MQTTTTWGRPILHVEVQLRDDGCLADTSLELVTQWLNENFTYISPDEDFTKFCGQPPPPSVESINVAEFSGSPLDYRGYKLHDVDLKVHTYRLKGYSSGSGSSSSLSHSRMLWTPDTLENDADNVDRGELDSPKATVVALPTKAFVGLWESQVDSSDFSAVRVSNFIASLIYDTPIQSRLLSYITSATLFMDQKVNSQMVNCSRLILLHGPPGTGKSTLCRGLAQKLSIRLRKRFSNGKFVEIDSHSLFSKWFGGSAKLVGQTFREIERLVDEDEDAFVCVLIDEVESLTSSRQSASANEPGDGVRATNALLTALDRLHARPNIVVLCTSNLIESMAS
ncbi:MAG: hypothetical protein M1840_001063 [Geoglossum simile]|nr:MAG: hypothetical protein M1840_001063 [Geoglossum simile]